MGCRGSEVTPPAGLETHEDPTVVQLDSGGEEAVVSAREEDTVKAPLETVLTGPPKSKPQPAQGGPKPEVKDRVPGRVPNQEILARADSLNRERQRRHDSIRAANGGVSPPRKQK